MRVPYLAPSPSKRKRCYYLTDLSQEVKIRVPVCSLSWNETRKAHVPSKIPNAIQPEHHAGRGLLIFTKCDSTITSGNVSSCKALGAKLVERIKRNHLKSDFQMSNALGRKDDYVAIKYKVLASTCGDFYNQGYYKQN